MPPSHRETWAATEGTSEHPQTVGIAYIGACDGYVNFIIAFKFIRRIIHSASARGGSPALQAQPHLIAHLPRLASCRRRGIEASISSSFVSCA